MMNFRTLNRNSDTANAGGEQELLGLLLEKVRLERRFLTIPYYTWWFEYNALEVFEPLNGFAPRKFWGEWTHFVENASDDLLELVQAHDAGIETLTAACKALQARLETSNELRQLYERYTSADVLAGLETTRQTLFGARPEEHHCSYLAQLIVNMTPPDCSPLYTIRPLWLLYGAEFLKLRESESFVGETSRLQQVATYLVGILNQLERRLTP